MSATLHPPSAVGATAPAIDAEHPWPGLASFTEESQALFFGRKKETDELVRLIRRNTVTVLFGQSGLGKSSLLCAGAFPALRAEDFLPIRLRLDHAVAAPPLALQVKTALLDACAAAHADARPPQENETLWEYFHRRDADIWSPDNRLLTPVLAFDQFEEIFTLGHASDEARARGRGFLTELADLVENRIPAALRARFESGELNLDQFHTDKPLCQVVLTLREDFLPDLESLKRSMRSIMSSRMRVCRLTGLQALEIVEKPAPHLLAEGVAEKIVEFVSGALGGSRERLAEIEVEPALLSVICRELNELRRARGHGQITADLVSGNRREILADFYERSVADLSEAMRLFVEDRLLTKSGFRDNLALETALEIPGVTRALVDTLVSRRLLRIEERLGVPRVELTHDVLAEVVRGSRDARQQRTALALARRRLWLARAAAAVLLVLFAGTGWLAWRSKTARETDARLAAERLQEETRRAEARRAEDARIAEDKRRAAAQLASRTDVAFAAGLLEDGRTADALAYFVRAAQEDPENSLLAPRLLGTLASRSFLLPDRVPLPLPSRASGIRLTSDGARMVFSCEDGRVRIVSVADWKIEREVSFGANVVAGSGIALAADNPNVFAVEVSSGGIHVCDMATGRTIGQPVRRPSGERPPVASGARIALSPDGRYLTSGDRTNVYVWDTTDGKLVLTLPFVAGNALSAFPISAGNRYVVSVPANEVIALHSPADGAQLHRIALGKGRNFGGCIFSPDGGKLVIAFRTSGNAPTGVRLYDVERQAWIGEELKLPDVTRVRFSRDSRRVVLPSREGEMVIADTATGKPLARPPRHPARVYDVDFSADGQTLLTSSMDGILRLWEVETGRLRMESTLPQERPTAAVLMPDARNVVMFSADPALIYRLEIGRSAQEPLILPRSNRTVAQAVFLAAPPTRLLWMMRESAKIIEVASGAELGGFSYPQGLSRPIPTIRGVPESGMVSPGQRVLARTRDNRWHVWSLGETGISHEVVLQGAPAQTLRTTLSPDGSLVTASQTGSGNLRYLDVWDTTTGERIRRIEPAQPVSPTPKSFSADNRFLAFNTSDGRGHLYELATGKEIVASRVTRIALRPDGSRFYATSNEEGMVTVRNAAGKLLRSTLPHRDQVLGFSLTPDGKLFASYSKAGSVEVADAGTGAPVGPKLLHPRPVRFVRFSPDGARLLVALTDGTGRVWDIRTGQPVTEVLRHGTESADGGFSADGRFVMLRGMVSGPVRIWSLPPESGGRPVPAWLLKIAAACAGRRLNESGEIVRAEEAFVNIEHLRAELAALPDDAPYVAWGRWLLSAPAAQSIAPGFTITPADSRKLREAYAAVAGVPVDEPDPGDDPPDPLAPPDE